MLRRKWYNSRSLIQDLKWFISYKLYGYEEALVQNDSLFHNNDHLAKSLNLTSHHESLMMGAPKKTTKMALDSRDLRTERFGPDPRKN